MLPSAVSAVALASATSVSGVTRCGVSRCSPAWVPTQTLPSRSSKTHCTASVANPCCRVSNSTGASPPASARTRHSPCPRVATQKLPRRSRWSCTPHPLCVVARDGLAPTRRNPSLKSVIQIVPSASSPNPCQALLAISNVSTTANAASPALRRKTDDPVAAHTLPSRDSCSARTDAPASTGSVTACHRVPSKVKSPDPLPAQSTCARSSSSVTT